MIGEMMLEEHADDPLSLTEVGAYEAIQSMRDLENDDSIIGFKSSMEAEHITGISATSLSAASHQDHMYVQRPKPIKCPQCRRYFHTEDDLLAHTTIRHSSDMMNQRFRCAECHNSYSSQGSLYKHQKIHTGRKQYVCETCQKSFNQMANLQRHFLVHTGEKPYECQTCGKRFSQQTNVDKHQVTHTKIKQFSCNICEKQFTQRANLKKHAIVHSGERPYVCPICLKSYAQHSNMKKHVLSHNKSNQAMAYLCAKCKNLYDTVLLYDAHLASCDGDNDDFNFELVVATDGESAEPTDELHSGNKINIMNVIKTEVPDSISQYHEEVTNNMHSSEQSLRHGLHTNDETQYLNDMLTGKHV